MGLIAVAVVLLIVLALAVVRMIQPAAVPVACETPDGRGYVILWRPGEQLTIHLGDSCQLPPVDVEVRVIPRPAEEGELERAIADLEERALLQELVALEGARGVGAPEPAANGRHHHDRLTGKGGPG